MAGQRFYSSCRHFASSSACLKKIPNNLKGRGKSSQEWLIRQMNDPYVKKAKLENYRARSAYKLLEMAERVPRLMSPGDVVLECGAAPGAWSQVALRAVNADGYDAGRPVGHVLGVDLLSVRPLPPAVHLQGDFSAPDTQRRLATLLPGPPQLVLSDMAPAAAGLRALDQRRILQLGYEVARFALRRLAADGSLLFKLWAGGGEQELRGRLAPFFERVVVMKPAASRADSSELYVVATGFRGAQVTGATVDGAQVTGATVDSAQVTGATVDSAQVTGAQVTGATVDGAQVTGATVDSAQVTGVTVDSAQPGSARHRRPDPTGQTSVPP